MNCLNLALIEGFRPKTSENTSRERQRRTYRERDRQTDTETWVCALVWVHMYVWRPEVSLGCHSSGHQSFSLLRQTLTGCLRVSIAVLIQHDHCNSFFLNNISFFTIYLFVFYVCEYLP